MLYYKVKPDSDQTRCNLVYKDQILIKDELYTDGEIKYALRKQQITQSFVNKHFIQVSIKKGNTHYFFGARFANSDALQETV